MFCKTVAGIALSTLLACGGGAASTEPPAAGATTGEPAATPAATAKRERLDVRFASAALGVEKRLIVILPADYASSEKRYPVVYMLHGLGGSEDNWVDLGIEAAADEVGLEAIIVLPDGDDGFYVNWQTPVDLDACLAGKRPFGAEKSMSTYCVRNARYGDYIAVDVVGFVDATYRTNASREGRAIGGLSMGGYGALVTAFSHPEMFVAVASHAGIDSLRYAGPDPFAAGKAVQFEDPSLVIKGTGTFGLHFARVFGPAIEVWKALDPAALSAKLKDGELAIYLDAGTQDEFRLHNGAQHLAEILTAAGISHELHIIEGGHHNSAFWTSRVPHSLRFFSERL